MKDDLGPNSGCAKDGVNVLLRKIQHNKSEQFQGFFNEWRELFQQVSSTGPLNKNILKELTKLYSLNLTLNRTEILFAIHTYIAIIIKFIASEILYQLRQPDTEAHLPNILQKSSSEFRSYLETLEKGEFFRQLGLDHFLEGTECFSWYLHEWDEALEKWLRLCLEVLSQYLFGPRPQKGRINDLFRNLYQKMITTALRRELGEVYTPKWLAEFIIEDIGYDGDIKKKVLDPACGSGTFLIHLIEKVRTWLQLQEKKLSDFEFQRSIVGFDLNPLAVLAARTNYLWAISDLIEPSLTLSIPVFVADSIATDDRRKNSVPPLFYNHFDYIIGNPPWINWEYLPESYKEKYMKLWQDYRLFPSKGWKGKLGYGKYDISAVFVYICMDLYLKNHGMLEFLVTQTLLRGIPGRGFRQYEIINETKNKAPIKLGLKKVHDLTQFQPFKDIINRTAIVQLIKNETTVYPIPYIEWEKVGEVAPWESWNDVKIAFQLNQKVASPIIKDDTSSRPLVVNFENQINVLRDNIFQSSDYKAREGANTEGLNCAFWIRNLKREKNGLIHFLQILKGAKKKIIAQTPIPIEPDLIYPLIRSGDLNRWHYTPDAFIIFTPKYNKNISNEDFFKNSFPKTYHYLNLNFKNALSQRKSFEKKSAQYPFYILFGTDDMKSPFKVCWNRMGNRINAAVITEYDDPFIGLKPPIPQETLIYLTVETLEEAHYLCAILNSQIFTDLVSMFSMKGSKGFAAVNILENVRIPKFDRNNSLHKQLGMQSRTAHDKVERGLTVSKIEETINQLAKDLFFANIDPDTRQFLEKMITE